MQFEVRVSVHKNREERIGALSPSFLGSALGADHEAESSGKIRDNKRRKVEDSKKGLLWNFYSDLQER